MAEPVVCPLGALPADVIAVNLPGEASTAGRTTPPDALVAAPGMRPSRLGKAPEVKEPA